MSYRVRLTMAAEADFETRIVSLAMRSPQVGQKVLASYARALERLRLRPLSRGLAYEHDRFDEEIRHLLFWTNPRRKYRALFTVRGGEVVILAIRAGGERPVAPEDLRE